MRSVCVIAFVACLAGCSSSESDPAAPSDGLLAPPAAGEGHQFSMVQTILPGEDIEYCKFVQAPAEGMNIQRQVVRYTAGSHHVLIMSTSYDQPPDDAAEGIFECDGFGDFQVNSLIAGAQSKESAFMENFPEDVAIRVEPGQWLIMNTHYLNTSSEPLEADARINVYTIPDEAVRERAGALFWYNFVVSLDPMSTGTTNAQCPVTADITMLDIQSHMHARGRHYEADVLDGKRGAVKQELYRNDEWEEVPVKRFDDGSQLLGPGDWIRWQCDYDNAEDRWVTQGAKATDEMCILFASYYPFDQNLEFCSNEGGIDNWMIESELDGGGATSCGDTLQCIIGAGDLFNDEYQRCIVDSCPSAGQEVTDVVKCHATDGRDANCNGDLSCLLMACNTEITACQAATCD